MEFEMFHNPIGAFRRKADYNYEIKKLLVLLLTSSMAVGLAACGSPAKSESVSEAGGDKAQDVVMWYYWENEGHQKALNEMLDKYNTSQSSYKMTAKYVPFADFKKQLSIGASASELPDLVLLDSPDHASYASMGIFSDLTGKFDISTYYDGPAASCSIDGKLYGVPLEVTVWLYITIRICLRKPGLRIRLRPGMN